MDLKILKWFMPYLLIGAFQFQVAKQGLEYSSPYLFMGIRYVLAAAVLLLISRRLVLGRYIIAVAASFSASTLLWILGLETVSPGDSAVLSYTMPFFALLGAIFILGEKPLRSELAGIFIGFVGIAIYTVPLYNGLTLAGTLLTIGGAVTWGVYSVYLKKLKDADPVGVVGTSFLIGSIPFLIGSIPSHQVQFTGTFLFDLAYISLLGGAISLFLWNKMLRMERIGKLTTMIFAVPAATLGLQALETMSAPPLFSIAGSAVMFAGIFVSYMKR